MRRLLFLLPSLVLLAGCADGGPAPLPIQRVQAGFPPGGIANVIRIDALDTLPLRAAELIAPDGDATPADSVDARQAPTIESGATALNSPWRSDLTGVRSAIANPGGAPGAALRGETTLLLTVSTAEIALPDPVAYRNDWAHYRIRLSFAAPGGEIETRELSAPQPPPS
jgi:hypothetical protein